MSLEKVLAEEAELEKLMYAPTENPVDEKPIAPVAEDVVSDDDDDDEIIVDSTEAVETTPQETPTVKQRQSWKSRFSNYKASTDKTISNLRKDSTAMIQRLKESNDKVDKLSSKLASLLAMGEDTFAGAITAEDVDIIGVEAIDIVKKATKKATESAVGPIKEELERLKAKELQRQEYSNNEVRKAEYRTFLNDLEKLVPDYATIDKDKNFMQYMDGYDPISGEKRVDIFTRSEAYLDADRVADFFTEYKEQLPKSKREILEDKVTPDSSSSEIAHTDKNTKEESFSASQVEKFFNDVTKGVYKNRMKEADQIEARITKAYINGNIY